MISAKESTEKQKDLYVLGINLMKLNQELLHIK